MSNARIRYTPHPETNPQAELDALAAVYSLCLRKHQERKKGAHPGAPNDGTKVKEYSADASIIPK
jgi:hypothetical protein